MNSSTTSPSPRYLTLVQAQRAIVVGGCLAMAYTQLTMSPATIEFARRMGANGLHVGILGALPSAMLFMQFVSAIVVNHLRYRRRLWVMTSIVERLIVVPVALGAWLLPGISDQAWVWWLILATALNHALLHFGSPLWLSWMGDYLPHRGLNRFWGQRHLWMQHTAGLSLTLAAIYLFKSGVDIRPGYATLIIVGSVCGLADLVFFRRIEEPPVRPLPEPKLQSVLTGPFRNSSFRSFIIYTCFWNFAAMVGAPFISLFLLAYIGMDLFHVLMIWAFSWFGGAVLSKQLGSLAENHGNRPVLVICTVFKGLAMAVLLFVTPGAPWAFWVLVPVFMIDALLNAGIAIASNGFLLKNSPRENRSMYIAAGTALAGMVGGATSIIAGAVLAGMGFFETPIAGLTWTPYHVVFLVSLLLRLAAIPLAWRVTEADTTKTRHVVTLLIGATPLRILRFPLGLYREIDLEEITDEATPPVPAVREEVAAQESRRRYVA